MLAGGGGDDGEELELGDGGSGDVEALGIGAGVGRGEEEAGVADEGVEQGGVGGGEAFEQVFRRGVRKVRRSQRPSVRGGRGRCGG